MPIKIVREGDLYSAEVTPPQGDWKSPQPMRSSELGRMLLSIGCDPAEIRQALLGAGVMPFSFEYSGHAERVQPVLRAALVGEREIKPQLPFSEAWLAYALFYYNRLLSLEEVLESADAINHAIPDPEQIAWAFLRLRKRGWLAIVGDLYGLTPEARRAIEAILTQDLAQRPVYRLEAWISTHPPQGYD